MREDVFVSLAISPVQPRALWGTDLFFSAGTVRRYPSKLAEILCSCTEFRTLSEHATVLAAAVDSPVAFIEELRRSGGFISYEEITRGFSEPNPVPHSEITTLTIPTRERPQEIRRALESYIASARRYSRKVRLFVADDSPASKTSATRDAVADVAHRLNTQIYYAERKRNAFL